MKQKLKELRDGEKNRKEAAKKMVKATNQVKELDKVRKALVNANPVVKKRMKERKHKLKKEIRETIKKLFPVVGETAEMKNDQNRSIQYSCFLVTCSEFPKLITNVGLIDASISERGYESL